MRSLLDFLVRHSYVFLFILLEVLSLVLLFGFNDRQKEAFLTSANSVSGTLFEWRTDVDQFFMIRKENAQLIEENTRLHSILADLVDSMHVYTERKLSADGVVAARVVDNSVRKDDNYMTIDKGSRDGIADGMGVYSADGVVGVIMVAGKRYSIVMPVLNGSTSISCKKRGSDSFGFLEWTGFSSVFPEGVPVGTISGIERSKNGYTLKIQVDLAVDMSNLGWVYVHTRTADDEIQELYEQITD